MSEPQNQEEWGIYLSGKTVQKFCEDNNIKTAEELTEWRYDNQDRLQEIFESIIYNYISEQPEYEGN